MSVQITVNYEGAKRGVVFALEPCRFCGACDCRLSSQVVFAFVWCAMCGAQGPRESAGKIRARDQRAVKLWNAAPPEVLK